MNTRKYTLSLVIAAYDSQFSITHVVNEAIKSLERSYFISDYELVIVDDGSKDLTWLILCDLASQNNRLKIVKLSKNFGQQSAMVAGFSVCNSNLIAYCDDDGESPVEQLDVLVEECIKSNVDMVWSKYSTPYYFSLRNLGRFINDYMLRIIFKKPRGFEFGNMWVAKKFVIDSALLVTTPSLYLGGIFLSITSNMVNVSLKKGKRIYGSTNYSFTKLVNIFMNGLIFSSIVPLRIASFIGFLFASLSFIFFIILLIVKILSFNFPVGYASLVCLILFISSIQLIFFGIIGEYVGRIYINTCGRPQYIISEKNF
jgi:glycosyltransferase involved in cell wall biosynthesis